MREEEGAYRADTSILNFFNKGKVFRSEKSMVSSFVASNFSCKFSIVVDFSFSSYSFSLIFSDEVKVFMLTMYGC